MQQTVWISAIRSSISDIARRFPAGLLCLSNSDLFGLVLFLRKSSENDLTGAFDVGSSCFLLFIIELKAFFFASWFPDF